MSELKAFLSRNGAKGGAAGTGSAKRRSREHYKRMARIAWDRRKEKAKKLVAIRKPLVHNETTTNTKA